jgi:hypothetical protein
MAVEAFMVVLVKKIQVCSGHVAVSIVVTDVSEELSSLKRL